MNKQNITYKQFKTSEKNQQQDITKHKLNHKNILKHHQTKQRTT